MSSAHRLLSDRRNAEEAFPTEVRAYSQFDMTANATPAIVKDTSNRGLILWVEQNHHYRFKAHLFLTVGATAGAAVLLNGTSLSPTDFLAAIKFLDFTTPAVTGARVTALASAVTIATGAVTSFECEIEGYIKPSMDGTLAIYFGQKTSDATASSVLKGSWFMHHEIPQSIQG